MLLKFNNVNYEWRAVSMCREINGVIFDTANATVDKKFTFGMPGDPSGYEETLYITVDGKYFIYTFGGAQSKYPDEQINPIRHEDVKAWVLSH
jgi:hypothetical protein